MLIGGLVFVVSIVVWCLCSTYLALSFASDAERAARELERQASAMVAKATECGPSERRRDLLAGAAKLRTEALWIRRRADGDDDDDRRPPAPAVMA